MIKGLHYVRYKRPGRAPRWYVYAWRGGPLILKRDAARKPLLGASELKLVQAALEVKTKVDPTTFRLLIRKWRSSDPSRPSSPEWNALAANTKRTWGRALDLIEEKWGAIPLEVWNDPRMTAKVVAWRDSRSATPRAADIGVAVLRALLEFGRLRGEVTINVASNIPSLYRAGQRSTIIWTDEDIDRFAAVARKRGRVHVLDGLRLAALTGLRREDLVTLSWDEVGEFAISKLAHKRSKGKRRHATIPRIPALNALLEELKQRPRREGVRTVLVNSFGEPWSGDGFGGSFNRIRDEAAISHRDEETGKNIAKHLHDVRGTFCTKLITEANLTDAQVAEIMGWSPDKVANIRRAYVSPENVVVAIGQRMWRLGRNHLESTPSDS